jgi:hypothetical protein
LRSDGFGKSGQKGANPGLPPGFAFNRLPLNDLEPGKDSLETIQERHHHGRRKAGDAELRNLIEHFRR